LRNRASIGASIQVPSHRSQRRILKVDLLRSLRDAPPQSGQVLRRSFAETGLNPASIGFSR
jgi:hypothetical protein